jgi:hypothetical protein
MNVISVLSAARASSCDGGEEGEMLGLALEPMFGLTLRVEGGAIIERGDGLVRGVLLGREWCRDELSVVLRGEISISSRGESRLEEARM